MRILVLKPYAGRTKEREHCERVARPGTVVDFRNLEGEFPISHVHHRYFRYKAIDAALEHVLRAEEEGYDAVCIACGADPGLYEARELVDIPVTSTMESAGHVAATMGHKFAVVTTVNYAVPNMEELALLYGFGHKMGRVRTLNIPGRNLYIDKTNPQSIIDRINQVAREAYEEEGVEVIVLTATLASIMYMEATDRRVTDMGIPIVDAMTVAFKMAEMMVDLKQLAGIPPISRVGAFRRPYEPEYRKMRAFDGRPLRRGLDPDGPPSED